MSNKSSSNEIDTGAWKNDASRQRWELFHRAISYAKRCNVAAMDEAEVALETRKRRPAALYLVD